MKFLTAQKQSLQSPVILTIYVVCGHHIEKKYLNDFCVCGMSKKLVNNYQKLISSVDTSLGNLFKLLLLFLSLFQSAR